MHSAFAFAQFEHGSCRSHLTFLLWQITHEYGFNELDGESIPFCKGSYPVAAQVCQSRVYLLSGHAYFGDMFQCVIGVNITLHGVHDEVEVRKTRWTRCRCSGPEAARQKSFMPCLLGNTLASSVRTSWFQVSTPNNFIIPVHTSRLRGENCPPQEERTWGSAFFAGRHAST